jgi:hypothetical protein
VKSKAFGEDIVMRMERSSAAWRKAQYHPG